MIISIPPRNTVNTETTYYWENFLTDEDIQKIISLPEWENFENSTIGGASCNQSDDNIRKSKTSWFFPSEETNHIWQKIINTIAQCNADYFRFDLTGCYEPAQLTLYSGLEENHYDWHIDSASQKHITPRKLSMSLLLSDPSEFEGGDLMVKTANDVACILPQKKGRAWFFPSYTLHKVTPVTKGTRKSLVMWISGPPFR
jgi:PKHD-type hydroxylase